MRSTVALLMLSMLLLPASAYSRHAAKTHSSMDSAFPPHIQPTGEKIVIVDPNVHYWGAYAADGELIKTGLATAGNDWCRDIRKPCRTKSGNFRVYSLGSRSCKSRKFPVPRGGAPMPYCMFFNGGQALHGSNEVVYGNVSHGCVRLHVSDAEWLRFNFVDGPTSKNDYRGTRVLVRPY